MTEQIISNHSHSFKICEIGHLCDLFYTYLFNCYFQYTVSIQILFFAVSVIKCKLLKRNIFKKPNILLCYRDCSDIILLCNSGKVIVLSVFSGTY